MKIACLHTAQVHVQTFDRLLIRDGHTLKHVVRPDLLSIAQSDGLSAVTSQTLSLLSDLADADAVLCTCSTLGPIVDQMAHPNVIRIDRPAFDLAVQNGGRILLALSLDSTRAASTTLLKDCARGADIEFDVLMCTDAWAAFTAGEMEQFYRQIAAQVDQSCQSTSYDVILLGQASMQGAAIHLRHLELPILTTPALAAQAVLTLGPNVPVHSG